MAVGSFHRIQCTRAGHILQITQNMLLQDRWEANIWAVFGGKALNCYTNKLLFLLMLVVIQ